MSPLDAYSILREPNSSANSGEKSHSIRYAISSGRESRQIRVHQQTRVLSSRSAPGFTTLARLARMNQNDTRIVDSPSISNWPTAHENFLALPLLCQNNNRQWAGYFASAREKTVTGAFFLEHVDRRTASNFTVVQQDDGCLSRTD